MKIGVAQMKLAETVGENTERILGFLEKGKAEGVQVLAFPETALTGYIYERFASLEDGDVERGLGRIAESVRGSGIHAIVGTPFREKGTLHNSAVVLYPDGRKALYHKNLLVSYEAAWFEPGRERLAFQIGGTTFGVIICRDQNSPELARELAGMGARAIFILSAHYYGLAESRLKREKNRALPIARAYENGVFVFKANAVGTIGGNISFGGSMIVDPRGITVLRAGDRREELLSYEVDFDKPNPRW